LKHLAKLEENFPLILCPPHKPQKNSLGFFYVFKEAMWELVNFSRGKPLGNQKEKVAYLQRFV
jgi:hypothetical protein